MYFPLFKLQVWSKRLADQPQTNESEVPSNRDFSPDWNALSWMDQEEETQ